MPEPDWRAYEHQIYVLLKEKAADATVTFDKDGRQKLPGYLSKVDRQIDVMVRGKFPPLDSELTLIVDCKCFSKRVNVGDVDKFIGMLLDVRQPMGLLITNVGFTQAAHNRATAHPGVGLELWKARPPTIAYTAGTNTATATWTTPEGRTYTEVIDPDVARRLLGEQGIEIDWP
jgi:hypothetical protein